MLMAVARSTRDVLPVRQPVTVLERADSPQAPAARPQLRAQAPAAVGRSEPAELALMPVLLPADAGNSLTNAIGGPASCDPGCPSTTLTRPALVVILNGSGAARSITTRVTSGRVLCTAARIFLIRESRLAVTAAV